MVDLSKKLVEQIVCHLISKLVLLSWWCIDPTRNQYLLLEALRGYEVGRWLVSITVSCMDCFCHVWVSRRQWVSASLDLRLKPNWIFRNRRDRYNRHWCFWFYFHRYVLMLLLAHSWRTIINSVRNWMRIIILLVFDLYQLMIGLGWLSYWRFYVTWVTKSLSGIIDVWSLIFSFFLRDVLGYLLL